MLQVTANFKKHGLNLQPLSQFNIYIKFFPGGQIRALNEPGLLSFIWDSGFSLFIPGYIFIIILVEEIIT